MTAWQRAWCTADNVGRYYRGRHGDPAAAAEILAQALRWREDYREVLSGAREPRWQTDLRVLTRGGDGVPIIYGCFRHNVPATSANLRDITEHMAAVLEAASRARRQGATNADTVMDCHGYVMRDNLNPAPMLALMRMVNQPYRDSLRRAIVVDAPRSFQLLWRAAAPLLSEKTKRKICFVSRAEAAQLVEASSGPGAAAAVDRVMALNREAIGCQGVRFPSELPGDDAGEERCVLVAAPVAAPAASPDVVTPSACMAGAEAAALAPDEAVAKGEVDVLQSAWQFLTAIGSSVM